MNKRIFISFAIEDDKLRDMLVGQSKNDNCPFEFYDMSVKKPWDEDWKQKCRTKIKGCDGVIAIITSNTARATGELWEISCSKEEEIPLLAIYGHTDDRPSLPKELSGISVREWKWDVIKNWINII